MARVVPLRLWLVACPVALLAAAGAGCSGCPKGFDDAGNLRREFFVGGGAFINWTATGDGTAFLVDRLSQRLLSTRSLVRGEVLVTGRELTDVAAAYVDVPAENIQIDLYFVPE